MTKRHQRYEKLIGALLLVACSGNEAAGMSSQPSTSSDALPTNAPSVAGGSQTGTSGTAASAPVSSKPAVTPTTGGAQMTAPPSMSGATPATSATPPAAAPAGMTASSAAAAGSGGSVATSTQSPGAGGPLMLGKQPVLPEITGECPKFATGEFSFGKTTGVMDVGPMGDGSAWFVLYWPGTYNPVSTYSQIGDENIKKIVEKGGIIVSIQGMDGQDSECTITGYYSKDYTDMGQIAACAVRDYHIDPQRLYVTGCSAGGVTSGCMATRESAWVAAVVTNSGGLQMVEPVKFKDHVPPVMTMYGGGSDFGGLFVTDSGNLNEAIKMAGGFGINCNHGGGHCGALPDPYYNAAMQFFEDHPYGIETEPYTMGLPDIFPSECVVYK